MSPVEAAVSVTPAGIPVVGMLMILGVLGFLVWDAFRFPASLWLKWLLPVGFVPLFIGGQFSILWLIFVGAGLMTIGFAVTKNYRQKKARRFF